MRSSQTLSAEFSLLCACCRWPRDSSAIAAIKAIGTESLEWDLVWSLVGRHRVVGLVHSGLIAAGAPIPSPFDIRLGAAAAQATKMNLRLASEAIRLQRAFSEARLNAVFLKGSAIEKLAYGTLGIKEAWDIDILVAPCDVLDASRLLGSCGYIRRTPDEGLPRDRVALWIKKCIESIFENIERGIFLELHWRLSDNALSVPGVGVGSPTQKVALAPGAELQTLADAELFAYLCEHGARHGWARLKWLADLAAFLGSKSQEEIDALYAFSQRAGIDRGPGQALLLCERFLGVTLPKQLLAQPIEDRHSRWLERIGLRALTDIREPGGQLLNIIAIKMSLFLLKDGLRYRWKALMSLLYGGTDMVLFALPQCLSFLYPILRIPSFVVRVALGAGEGPLRVTLRR